MTLFVDASALVAIIADEPERVGFLEVVLADGDSLWSAMSCWETVASLRHTREFSLEDAREKVSRAGETLGLRLVPINGDELRLALDAYEQFGKGRHPARLNMGDCFAYACAKTNNASLLYKGDDFVRTDLA